MGCNHDVAAYIQERDNTVLKVKTRKKRFIVIPKIKLDNKIFNKELTLVLDFKPKCATQDGKTLSYQEQNGKYLLDFSPFKGKILLEKE